MSKRKQKKQRKAKLKKIMKPLFGFQVDVSFIVAQETNVKDLMAEIEQTLRDIDETYILEDFDITAIYENPEDDNAAPSTN